jgi:hypothetical protein
MDIARKLFLTAALFAVPALAQAQQAENTYQRIERLTQEAKERCQHNTHCWGEFRNGLAKENITWCMKELKQDYGSCERRFGVPIWVQLMATNPLPTGFPPARPSSSFENLREEVEELRGRVEELESQAQR